MNDANDPTIEPSPVPSNDGTEAPPKRIRKRAPQRDVAPQAGTDAVEADPRVRAPDSRQSDDSPGNAEVTLQRGDDAPAPSLAGTESPHRPTFRKHGGRWRAIVVGPTQTQPPSWTSQQGCA